METSAFLALITMGLVSFAVIYEAAFFALASRHFDDKGQPSLDYLVVLGARVLDHGPCAGFARRIEAAKAHLESNPGTICIACGGRGDDELVSEASCASMCLRERGIEPDRIILEDNSRNTSESLRNVAGIVDVGQDRIGIVTSGYHLFRALAIARWLGMTSVVGISAGNPPRRTAAHLARESLAMAKDAATFAKSRKR